MNIFCLLHTKYGNIFIVAISSQNEQDIYRIEKNPLKISINRTFKSKYIHTSTKSSKSNSFMTVL